jgi:hypothetical protein
MKKISCLLIIILIGVAIDADAKKIRKFYLTKTGFTGSQALTACAKKYHMASMWEIFDVSTLRYDTENGLTVADSGSGPPAVFSGWIRTGISSDNSSPIAGIANCSSWTTDTGFGSVIGLNSDWHASGSSIMDPWEAAFTNCFSPFPVWCVQD